MGETKTLSKVEIYALAKARELFRAAHNDFNVLLGEVLKAHGIEPKDYDKWILADDLTALNAK